MKVTYTITTKENSLRSIHNLTIGDESISTTRSTEVLLFAKPRIASKYCYKELKAAIRDGEPLQIN